LKPKEARWEVYYGECDGECGGTEERYGERGRKSIAMRGQSRSRRRIIDTQYELRTKCRRIDAANAPDWFLIESVGLMKSDWQWWQSWR
jgi:hypothetical protein